MVVTFQMQSLRKMRKKEGRKGQRPKRQKSSGRYEGLASTPLDACFTIFLWTSTRGIELGDECRDRICCLEPTGPDEPWRNVTFSNVPIPRCVSTLPYLRTGGRNKCYYTPDDDSRCCSFECLYRTRSISSILCGAAGSAITCIAWFFSCVY
jgi:hypothetical protein